LPPDSEEKALSTELALTRWRSTSSVALSRSAAVAIPRSRQNARSTEADRFSRRVSSGNDDSASRSSAT
jgi:hypothetical protein